MQDTEYQSYLQGQSHKDLVSIRNSLNKAAFPDRYAMVIAEIEARDKLAEAGQSPSVQGDSTQENFARPQEGRGKMTSREITGVALKCLAMYLLFVLVATCPMLVSTVTALFKSSPVPPSTASILMFSVPSLIGIVFFSLLAYRLADSLLRTAANTETDVVVTSELTPENLQAILFRIIGVYIVVGNIKPLVLTLSTLVTFWISTNRGISVGPNAVVDLISLLVSMVIGMCLIAKPKAWVTLFNRAWGSLLKKTRRE